MQVQWELVLYCHKYRVMVMNDQFPMQVEHLASQNAAIVSRDVNFSLLLPSLTLSRA